MIPVTSVFLHICLNVKCLPREMTAEIRYVNVYFETCRLTVKHTAKTAIGLGRVAVTDCFKVCLHLSD